MKRSNTVLELAGYARVSTEDQSYSNEEIEYGIGTSGSPRQPIGQTRVTAMKRSNTVLERLGLSRDHEIHTPLQQ